MKLIPASRARWMILMDASWSGSPQAPNIMAPRQSGLTCMPVRPRLRYSMIRTYGALLLGASRLGHLAVHLGLRGVGHHLRRGPLPLGLHRAGDPLLLALHQRLEALLRDQGRVVLLARADVGVQHLGPVEELGVGGPGH